MSTDFKHEFESLTELGKEIGLEGDTLRDFIIEERKKLKEERDRERDIRAAERERERQIRAIELEEKRLEQEKEILEVRQKHEKEENEARRQHEKEMSEAQAIEAARVDQYRMVELDKEEKTFLLQAKIAEATLEATKIESTSAINPSGHDKSGLSKSKYKPLKLPKYDETKDDMDAYINRFERYAVAKEWEEEVWALNFSTLLTGQGLQVYDSLTPADADNYQTLKKALLRRYKHTEEGYREKFKQAKPEVTESAEQFVTRIRRYLLRWVELAESGDSVDELIDLLTRDQFLHSCPKKMACHIIERDPKDTETLGKLADQYIKAHEGWQEKGAEKHVKESKPNQPKVEANQTKPNYGGGPSGKTGTQPLKREPITCFLCNRKGHRAKDCFRKGTLAMVLDSAESAQRHSDHNRPTTAEKYSHYGDRQQVSYHNRPSNTSTASIAGALYSKTQTNQSQVSDSGYHSLRSDQGLFNDHRPSQFQSHDNSSGRNYNQDASTSTWQQGKTGHISLGLLCSDLGLHEDNIQHAQEDCGCQRDFLGATCKLWDNKRMPLKEGTVEGKVVKVYRDTGCSGVVVREHLVKPHQYTGQVYTCFFMDGTERRYPVAKINISSPYLNGEVHALVMETSICDLVIGQHPEVRDPEISMSTKQAESVGTQTDFKPDLPTNAKVKTHVQKSSHPTPSKPKRSTKRSSNTTKTVYKNVTDLEERKRKMDKVKKQMGYRKACKKWKATNDRIVSQQVIHANKRRKYHHRPSVLTKGNSTTPDLVAVAVVQNNEMKNRPSLKVLHLPVEENYTEHWHSSHFNAYLKSSRTSIT